MKRLVLGILAHVDAGKTTLSESMLYISGVLRKLGRVDHGDAFLDTDVLERERGITIFSKQALLSSGEMEITLLDTPGHVDFSAEMERTLQVLDYAVLVISGTDGIQGHTRTLWKLLKRYNIPTFLFVNKMDLPGTDKTSIMKQLINQLDPACVDFTDVSFVEESVAVCSEAALEQFLEFQHISDDLIASLIKDRKVFPCWFGSALKLEGVEDFLTGFEKYTTQPNYPKKFGAKVFKISRDTQGTRLTWMKITGGTLKAKDVLSSKSGNNTWSEKADQLRLYSGGKFTPISTAEAGLTIAVSGLTKTFPGQGLGIEPETDQPILEPTLTYQLILPNKEDPYTVLPKLKQLEDEDPMLNILWNEAIKEIHVQLMGEVQLEILTRLIADRFNITVQFGKGSIVYKETITNTVEGIGHFEPLRHYAEVHLLMEPAERGSGISVSSACSTDHLDMNWQRMIMTHILEREHVGVLTGSAVTDIKFTVIAGRAHLKHTEGGDFRQATYRAIRQGLMQAKSILLEPFYDFVIELPNEYVGRAMTDLQNMGAELETPILDGEQSIINGYGPVSKLRGYWQEVNAYTKGLGHLSFTFRGYEHCHNQDEIVLDIGYSPERDIENPSDSVFCSHGSGFNVKWNEVRDYMHVDSGLNLNITSSCENEHMSAYQRSVVPQTSIEQDKELLEIFERTYGKVEYQAFYPQKKPARTSLDDREYNIKSFDIKEEFLLVDGYNIIFAWEDLKTVAHQDISAARAILIDILSNYQGYKKCTVIIVFDAYKVKGNPGSVEKIDNIYVVYTKEAETADTYIEKATYSLGKGKNKVRVATSDNLEQLIILGHGAFRISAESFKSEIEQTQGEITKLIEKYNRQNTELTKFKHIAKIKTKND